MFGIMLLHPIFLIGIPLAAGIAWLYHKRQVPVEHSQVALHHNIRSFSTLGLLPTLLFGLTISAGCIALSRPVVPHTSIDRQIPAIDVFVSADISSDMDDPSDPSDPKSMPEDKLSALTPSFFVEHMDNARVALSTFATKTYIYWPFSTDQKTLKLQAQSIAKLSASSESESYDGPNGPIQTAVTMFSKYSQAKTKVFVLITDADADGFIKNEANAAMIDQLKQMNVHMYLIVIGSDGPFSMDTDLVRFVESFGEYGHVIRGINPEQMSEAAVQINKLERTPVTVESTPVYADIYFPFVIAAMVFFGLTLLARALFRQSL